LAAVPFKSPLRVPAQTFIVVPIGNWKLTFCPVPTPKTLTVVPLDITGGVTGITEGLLETESGTTAKSCVTVIDKNRIKRLILFTI